MIIYEYTSADGGYYQIAAGSCEVGDVVIPSQHFNPAQNPNPLPVKKIKDYAFANCSTINSITLPNTITAIGIAAFYNCINLNSITLSTNLTSIEGSAFKNTNISNINLPNSLVSFGYTTVSEQDGFGVFENSPISSISFGDNVNFIAEGAFSRTLNLLNISVSSQNQFFSSSDGILYDKLKTTIRNYPAGKPGASHQIINSVSTIGSCCFIDCQNLNTIIMNANVTSLSFACFGRCSNLTSVQLPNSITEIPYSAFSNCSSLEEIVMPDSLTHIRDNAFTSCEKLERIYLNNGLTFIGYQTFENCTSLKAITIPSSINQVAPVAFKNSGLISAYFMGNLPPLLDPTFMALTSNATVWRKSGALGWPTSFQGGLIEVKILDLFFHFDGSYYSIGKLSAPFQIVYNGSYYWALPYQYDDGINGIKKIIGINNLAFAYSTVIKNIIIPGSMWYIGDAAFAVSSLLEIYIPASITILKNEAFGDYNGNPSTASLLRTFLYSRSLQNINVSPNNLILSSLNGVLFNKNKTILIHLPSKFFSYSVPDGVLSFAEVSIDTSNVATIDLPASVTSLPRFDGALNLSGININPNHLLYSSDSGVLFDKNKTQLILFPPKKNSGNDPTIDLNTYYVPSSTTGISPFAFKYNRQITEIFGDSKPQTDPSLAYVVLGTGIKIFDDGIFALIPNCFGITFPSSALKITNNSIFALNQASNGMNNLRRIGISSGNAKIETSTNFFNLENLINLEAINVDQNNQNYSSINGVLYDKDRTILLAHPPKKYQSPNDLDFIPNTVTGIGYKAFDSSHYLTGLWLPNSLKSIADFAFIRASGITSISIPSGVNDISTSAFVRMQNLEYINVDPINENFYSYKNIALINKNQNSLVRVAPNFKGSIFAPPTLSKIEDFALDEGRLSNIYFSGLPINNWDATYKPMNSLSSATLGALIDPRVFAFRYKTSFGPFWKTVNNLNYKILPWSNNVAKSGGTGKLIGLPKTYYISDSYQFTVNESNFNLTGPIRKISDSEKNILLSFGFEEVDEWYRSVFLNFLVIPQVHPNLGPPTGPFNTYYSWNIFYFNFNDLGDAENGIKTFYYSDLFPTRKKLEEVGTWNNAEAFYSSNTITFTLK